MTFYTPRVSLVTIASLLAVALVTVSICISEFYHTHFDVLRSKEYYLCRPMGITTKFRRAQLNRRRIALSYDYNIKFRKRDIEKKKQVK